MDKVPVRTVNIKDVLSGRGNGPNHHSGNIVFRRIVAGKSEAYHASSCNKEKQRLIREIIDEVESTEGRFLSKMDANGSRRILDWDEKKRKTAQAFRDLKKNDETDDKISPNRRDTGLSPTNDKTYNPQPEILVEPTHNPHLEKSFNWETLKNGNDGSLNDSIVDALMASRVSMGITPLPGLRYQGHDNEECMDISVSDGTWEVKNDEPPPQSNSTSTKGINNEWSTTFTPNKSLPTSIFNENHEAQDGNLYSPFRSAPSSFFGENQDAKYGNQDCFTATMDQTAFSDEHGNVQNKSNEQGLSSRTKHTDPRNEAPAKKFEEHGSIVPNSGQSDIPLKYSKLMRESIISWRSRRNLEVEDDESEDNTDEIRTTNGSHEVKSDHPSSTSAGLHETDQNNPFDMSFASLVQPSDFSENREAIFSNKDRFALRKSILTLKGLLSLSQRKLISNEGEDDESDPDDIQSTHGHEISTNDDIHEANSDQPMSSCIAPNQSAENYSYAARNDTNEMSLSSLFSIERIKKMFQNEKEDHAVSLNDSVSDFSFDDNLTDNESDDGSRENFRSDMRGMLAKFKSMSNRDLVVPV